MREWIIQAETIGNISDGYWYGDGEEIVRCKDCKHSRTDDVFGGRWCQLPGSIKLVREEFFCADGERKDDE